MIRVPKNPSTEVRIGTNMETFRDSPAVGFGYRSVSNGVADLNRTCVFALGTCPARPSSARLDPSTADVVHQSPTSSY